MDQNKLVIPMYHEVDTEKDSFPNAFKQEFNFKFKAVKNTLSNRM